MSLQLTPIAPVRAADFRAITQAEAHEDPRPLAVVLTGAGISAESGVKTFRDHGGLWEQYDVMTVASYEGWRKNPELVLDFYNQRRAQLPTVTPNAGHTALCELEKAYRVVIVTQNVDDLHERAGSQPILHLHGQLTQVRPIDSDLHVYDIGSQAIRWGDVCPETGEQLRPHIVWFGEAVPFYPLASEIVGAADVILVVGTSMQVYPAAGLVDDAAPGTPIYHINPEAPPIRMKHLQHVGQPASTGVAEVVQHLLAQPVPRRDE
jgi:NAD-dependent deacetylase